MGKRDWGLDFPGGTGWRLRAREVTVTLQVTVTCLLAALLFSACGQAAQPVSTETLTQSPTPSGSNPDGSVHQDTPTSEYKTPSPTQTLGSATICDLDYGQLDSPDGDWKAIDCVSANEFIVINLDRTKRWSIPFDQAFSQLIADSEFNYTEGHVFPYYWSGDNQFIYFIIFPQVDATGDYSPFKMQPAGFPIYRLDTQDGQWAKYMSSANNFFFSPSGNKVAAISQTASGVTIGIKDTTTGDEHQYSLDHFLAAGYGVWSEDGLKFFFSAVKNPSTYADAPDPTWYKLDYSLDMIDVNAVSLITLQNFHDSWSIIYPVKWINQNTIIVQFDTYDSQLQLSSVTKYFDLITKQFIPITAAPTP